MKTRKAVLAILLAVPLLAVAQTRVTRDPLATPGIDQRQANQQRRIDQGVASGSLTTREAARLQRGQQHVQNLEDRAKADGRVTASERRRIQHAEDVQSRKIARAKHDRQHDFNHDGRIDRPQRR